MREQTLRVFHHAIDQVETLGADELERAVQQWRDMWTALPHSPADTRAALLGSLASIAVALEAFDRVWLRLVGPADVH